jgi:NADPH-dependent curcumin reductase CurA
MDRNLQLIVDGIVDPLVDQTEFIGVEDAVEAVEFLHSGKNIGKVVLKY